MDRNGDEEGQIHDGGRCPHAMEGRKRSNIYIYMIDSHISFLSINKILMLMFVDQGQRTRWSGVGVRKTDRVGSLPRRSVREVSALVRHLLPLQSFCTQSPSLDLPLSLDQRRRRPHHLLHRHRTPPARLLLRGLLPPEIPLLPPKNVRGEVPWKPRFQAIKWSEI